MELQLLQVVVGGLLLGAPHAFFLRQKIKSAYRPINVHWSIYRPSLSGLQELTHLAEKEIIKPIIDSVYSLSDISEAHKKVATGHGSGKVVINRRVYFFSHSSYCPY